MLFRFIFLLFIFIFNFNLAHADVRFWQYVWPQTDFDKAHVDLSSILDGGPGKDNIPAISNPEMHPIKDDVSLWEMEPVMVVAFDHYQARAYPIRYLMWHEIVNDQIGEDYFSVTFCPLCNSGKVFDRYINGDILDFKVSGLLRHSDMIMYDQQSESWWQQFTGKAIVGERVGQVLNKIPSTMMSWKKYKEVYPNGLVQKKPPYNRDYGRNPYVGYDRGEPFFYQGEKPPHNIKSLARVVVVDHIAWPLARLRNHGQINEKGYRITWENGMNSALDDRVISQGRDIGQITVTDAQGRPVAHDISFAFAFHAFTPNGIWMLDPQD